MAEKWLATKLLRCGVWIVNRYLNVTVSCITNLVLKLFEHKREKYFCQNCYNFKNVGLCVLGVFQNWKWISWDHNSLTIQYTTEVQSVHWRALFHVCANANHMGTMYHICHESALCAKWTLTMYARQLRNTNSSSKYTLVYLLYTMVLCCLRPERSAGRPTSHACQF